MPDTELPETHTAVKLSKELLKAGLEDMADKARTGYYHDYLSPLAMPSVQLLNDLKKHGKTQLIKRHMNGEFDASPEESDDWAKSDEGKAIASELGPEISKILGMG